MRFMAQNFFANSPVLELAIVALLVFVLLFVAILIRVMRSNKKSFDVLAHMPLEDREAHHE